LFFKSKSYTIAQINPNKGDSMAKSKDVKKEVKKKPEKSLKEKRNEKKAKKDA